MTVRDEIMNYGNILQMSSDSVAAEVIVVWLSALAVDPPVDPIDADPTPSYVPIVLTVPTPSVHVSYISCTVTDMEWDAIDYGSGEILTSVFTVIGNDYAQRINKPSWVDVVLASTLGDIEFISHGETIGVYPNSETTQSRTGQVVFTDNQGNTIYINLTQLASVAVPAVYIEIHPELFYGSDGNTEIYLSGDEVGTATAGSNEISITFTPNDDSLPYYTGFSMGYQLFRNGFVAGGGSMHTILNGASNTRTLTMTSTAVVGDSIVVLLNELI